MCYFKKRNVPIIQIDLILTTPIVIYIKQHITNSLCLPNVIFLAGALTTSVRCFDAHRLWEDQPVEQLHSGDSGLVWAEQCSCPQPNRSHAFLGVQRRQQVLLAQELQGKVHQQPSHSLHLLSGLLGVSVTEALLGSVLLQLSCAVHSVVGQAFEDLDVGYLS